MKLRVCLLCVAAVLLSGCVELPQLPSSILPSSFATANKSVLAAICNDYKSNVIAGEEKWLGQTVTISGTLESITSPKTGLTVSKNYSIMVKEYTKGKNEYIASASFAPVKSNMQQLGALKQGQTVTVEGKITFISCNTNDGILAGSNMIFLDNSSIK
jgi:predicted acyltransferase (DUF342 family)